MGLPYDTSERHLLAFDTMCSQRYPTQATLSKDMAMEWVVKRPDEHVNGQMRRISPVRQLAKYMASVGAEAYVIPKGIPGRQVHYRPHIFSHRELRALFDAADTIQPTPYGGRRELIIPVMFRMLYCLGLRPGEARKLHRNDVDLARGSVMIRESKGHKDRMVFLSPDLEEYCRQYDAAISSHHPDRIPFFPPTTRETSTVMQPRTAGSMSCCPPPARSSRRAPVPLRAPTTCATRTSSK